ncbi:mechanosensitive ion channel family protein [Candidatus Wolfebacteria bacterium]|nr:mechanosensitive ion channel family protein [Candidatus Wolfebacteria bacterium]
MFEIGEKIIQVILFWLASEGLKVFAIIAGAWIFHKFGGIFIEKVVRKAVVSDHFLSKEAEKKREDTLTRVFSGTLRVLVWLIASMMALSSLGLNIGPIMAAAGIAGVAFGFGGQYLIRDVISGLFIIFENQYRVGDVVCFDKICGSVENITLRTTILRDLDGTVHHVPNGEIKIASNLSKDFAGINLNIGISYSSDLEKVIKTINQVGNEMAEDSKLKEFIIKPPQFLRVNDFADSSVIIKITGETKPLKQWEITGELRKRLKIAFDRDKIEIPFPQVVIHEVKE